MRIQKLWMDEGVGKPPIIAFKEKKEGMSWVNRPAISSWYRPVDPEETNKSLDIYA